MKLPDIESVRYDISELDLAACKAVYELYGCAIGGFSCECLLGNKLLGKKFLGIKLVGKTSIGKKLFCKKVIRGEFIFNIYERCIAIRSKNEDKTYVFDLCDGFPSPFESAASQGALVSGSLRIYFSDIKQYNLVAMAIKYSDHLFFSGCWSRRELMDDFDEAPPPNKALFDALVDRYTKANLLHDMFIGNGRLTIHGSQNEVTGEAEGEIFFMISDWDATAPIPATLDYYCRGHFCALNVVVRHNNRNLMQLAYTTPFKALQEEGKYSVCLQSNLHEFFVFEFTDKVAFDRCITYLHLYRAGNSLFG